VISDPIRLSAVEQAELVRSGEISATYLDKLRDPDVYAADLARLAPLKLPVRVTQGTESLPEFAWAIDRLVEAAPQIERETIQGAGHVPQLTMPAQYAEMIASFARENGSSGARRL
jgi:pimeloyl-ACP methyl ester carboxylesterase